MVELTAFKKHHLPEIELQECDIKVVESLSEARLEQMEDDPDYVMSVLADGKCIGVIGIAEYWAGRAEVWAIMGKGYTEKFLSAHKLIKKRLLEMPYRRLEYTAATDFPEAHRWAKALGFELECETMKAFNLEGKDCSMYALVRGA